MARENEQERKLNVEITPLIKKIEALTKRIIKTKTLGEYISVFKGAGLEFDGYKEYSPDIDASAIDWKASARTKQILIRKYRQVKELEVYLMVDVSQKMVFGSTVKLKNEYSAELALAMAYIILSTGDSVGLLTFSDTVLNPIKAAKGVRQFHNLARHIINPDIYGGGYNIAYASEFALNFIKRKNSVVILISDFYGMTGPLWQRNLKLLRSKFDLFCIVVRDPRDKYLPHDVNEVLLQDPSTGQRLLIDSSLLKQRYAAYTHRQDAQLFRFFKETNIDYLETLTDEDFIRVVFNFFTMRRLKMK
ncbi:MAG: DUF58 domain-containing protein [Candidatus Woesearchaeota archaeon]